MFHRVSQDIKSFISGRDLVVFAIGIGLSNQLQATLKTLIDSLIMPVVSQLTGVTNLNSRSLELQKPKGNNPGIKVAWGAALQSIVVFAISLVVMVEIARYVTVHYVKSTSVTFV